MAHVLSLTVVEFARILKLNVFFKSVSREVTVESPLVSGEPLL